jgi:hypothetical protein
VTAILDPDPNRLALLSGKERRTRPLDDDSLERFEPFTRRGQLLGAETGGRDRNWETLVRHRCSANAAVDRLSLGEDAEERKLRPPAAAKLDSLLGKHLTAGQQTHGAWLNV